MTQDENVTLRLGAALPDGGADSREVRPATSGRAVNQPQRGKGVRAARQGTLREHNLSLVLVNILDSSTDLSRADLATLTGLARATVSALVDVLVDAKIVVELDPFQRGTAGRPGVPLQAARGTIAGLGLEVNIDYLGARAIDLAGQTLAERIVAGDFRRSDHRDVLAALTTCAREVTIEVEARGVKVVGARMALPGMVDQVSGPLRLAPNLGWRNVDFTYLRQEVPFDALGVGVANEANLAAIAEMRARRNQLPSFLYVSGEVGIGAAFVHNNSVFTGEHGWSGELGHTVIEPEGPICGCGSRGCLEQYAGKDALMDAAGLDIDDPIDLLIKRGVRGEPKAVEALARGGWALGIALANFINLTDVSHVILGGIYGPLAELLSDPVRRELSDRVLTAQWSTVEVEASISGPEAAMSGAALSVLRELVANPAAWVSGTGILLGGSIEGVEQVPVP